MSTLDMFSINTEKIQCLKDPLNTDERDKPDLVSRVQRGSADQIGTEEEFNTVMVSDSIKEERGACPVTDQCSEEVKNAFCPAEEFNIVMVSDSIKEERGAYTIADQCSVGVKNSSFCPAGMAGIKSLSPNFKEEEDACSMDHQNYEIKGSVNNCTDDPLTMSGISHSFIDDNKTLFQQEMDCEQENKAAGVVDFTESDSEVATSPTTVPTPTPSEHRTRTPCGRRRRPGVNPRPIYSEAEVAALVFSVQRNLPRILQGQAGGRPGKGYALAERRKRWREVRRFMRKNTGVERTPRQLMHRWADLLDREEDLLDLLGVEVEGLGSRVKRRGRKAAENTSGSGQGTADDDVAGPSVQSPEEDEEAEEAAVAADQPGDEGEAGVVANNRRRAHSRQESAARQRAKKMDAIAREYRHLVLLEEKEEEVQAVGQSASHHHHAPRPRHRRCRHSTVVRPAATNAPPTDSDLLRKLSGQMDKVLATLHTMEGRLTAIEAGQQQQ